jgi:hypothetical protein
VLVRNDARQTNKNNKTATDTGEKSMDFFSTVFLMRKPRIAIPLKPSISALEIGIK